MARLLWNKRPPLTVQELLNNTDSERLRKASEEISIDNYTTELVLLKSEDKTKDVSFVLFNITTRNKDNNNKYSVKILLPYFKRYSKKNLMTLPAKCYSSTPDFKFRFAYLYNKSGNLYLTPDIKESLGIAIRKAPLKTNPEAVRQLDKHLACALLSLNKLTVKL